MLGDSKHLWSIVNGQWSMVNGQESRVNGQESRVNGQWSRVKSQWSMVNGQWSLLRSWCRDATGRVSTTRHLLNVFRSHGNSDRSYLRS